MIVSEELGKYSFADAALPQNGTGDQYTWLGGRSVQQAMANLPQDFGAVNDAFWAWWYIPEPSQRCTRWG